MSVFVLITGVLQRRADNRTAKSGNPYALGTIRVRDGNETSYWGVLAFGEAARDELLRLEEGDAVSAQGRLEASLHQRDGVHRVRLSILAESVRALRKPPPPRAARKAAADRPAATVDQRTRQDRCRGVADSDLDDAIPF